MASLQQAIAKTFLAKLSEKSEVRADQVEELRKLLEASNKPKPDDLVKIFTAPADGDVK
jgi:hypothetical protein